ncbi:TonB-dependent siderophore receptor [Lutibaculum baratangense]|uniref:Ferrichrome-iron receptor n=1 Tax=Lutibaculum baratangense AMV1 TaxID=631454 RepID=V4RK85_9HYPH|nr:TonB-dependent siderophore receptor [Lutibaculum baratangense]ESR26451.1 Ferrichrome-iron receptor [Lutibaculum baratangense AMV1]
MHSSRNLLRRLLVSSVPVIFAGGPAFSQTAVELDTVVVEAENAVGVADPAPVDGYVARDVTAGSKTAAPLVEVPQSVSVIGSEELQDRGVQKVDEALRYTPGVFAQPFGADSDTDWIYIRGFDATQSGVFLDGLQLYSYAFAGITVDPFLIDRIEVLRGPASVLYGGSSAGGIVNSVLKRADGQRYRYVEAGIDDNPNGYVGADIGDRFSETSPWSWRLVGRVKGGDTQTDHADNFRGVVSPSVLFEGESTRLEVYGLYQYDDQRHMGGFWPYVGSVVRAPYGVVPRDLFYSEPGVDKFEAQQAALGFELEHDVNDWTTLRSNTRWIHVEREEYGPYPYDWDTTDDVLNRINFAHDTKADLFETDNQAIFDFQTGAVSHQLLAGVDYRHYRIDQWQATGPADPLDPVDPDYTNELGALFAPYIDEKVSLDQLGVYVQDQLKFGGGWIATLNARYDQYWIDRGDRTAAHNDYDVENGAFSGRAGLAYEFPNGFVPYVSVSKLFEPQIGTNTAGQPVGAQDGEQYEAGIKWAPTFMPAVFTASVFDLTRRNTLQSRQLGDGSFVNEALGEVRSRGIELEAKANITESLKLAATFTTYDLEIEDDANPAFIGNQPYLIPETLASLWIDYTVRGGTFDGLGFGAGVRYQGESYADNENTLKVPDATVFDAAIRYERDNWGVSLTAKNVFDKEYVAGCGGIYTCGYGEGRTLLLQTHVTF